MKRNRKTLTAIVVVISMALLGLIWLQIVLLDRAFELKTQAFRQNVNAALNSIVSQLEEKEMVSKAVRVMLKVDTDKPGQTIHGDVNLLSHRVDNADSALFWKFKNSDLPRFDVEKGTFSYSLASPQHIRLRILDTQGNEIHEVLNEYKPAGQYEVFIDTLLVEPDGTVLNFLADSSHYNMTFMPGNEINLTSGPAISDKRSKMIGRIISRLTEVERQPIETRIMKTTLDSTVKATLVENDILIPVDFGVHTISKDTIKLADTDGSIQDLKNSEFRSKLFPNDPFYSHNDLVLYFPQQTMYLIKENSVLLGSTVILLSVIVFFFIFTLRTIFKQKRFAVLLTDFINNMTHEFKTPISTISLASEALSNSAVQKNKDKLQQYNTIIKDENHRMRNQVDKILQMAVLEEGEFELNIESVDIHQIINDTVANVRLQIEKKNGSITCDFLANPSTIQVDPVHMANVVRNLIDNANKYTREQPSIHIKTRNNTKGVIVTFSDNGIGLKIEDQKHIFDKFYRVSTGNVHDVKGFGLGLSYVKLIVEAHGGTVSVESEINKGSTFQLFLPYQTNNGKYYDSTKTNPAD